MNPFFKSEDLRHDEKFTIRSLVGGNFDAVVMDNSLDVIVRFHKKDDKILADE